MKDERSTNHPKSSEISPSEEHQVRVEKVEAMRQAGIEPWPAVKKTNAQNSNVIDEFCDDKESRQYELSGRVVTIREHGKTAFAHIKDSSGRLQLYIRADLIGQEAFDFFKKYIDIGDTIWVAGHSFKTKMGEITLKVTALSLQSKCLYPLPEKFHGLTDVETKYRQRYLDLISNDESTQRFVMRSHIVRLIRRFLDDHGYMEVETPMLHPIPGGAVARPFVTHHNALDMDLYLRIAPELYLKRLVVGGLDRVYEINRSFRNEGISTRHNPEFTMLEFYTAYQDYEWAMDLTENMIKHAAQELHGSLLVPYADYTLNFEKPFTRMNMIDAVAQYGNCSIDDLQEGTIDTQLKKHGITLDNKQAQWGHKLTMLFETLVEPTLQQPTFITGFPVEVSPLSKRNPNDTRYADRFELFIAGMELSNGFNELNDPFDQAERFKDQVASRDAGDAEAHHYDADYVHALEHGLPPTVGVGVGIDRLTMLLTNTTSIKDVILFPTLKRKQD